MNGPVATEDVPAAFDVAAPRYDLMVALNPGYHRHLRSAAGALVGRLAATGKAPVLVDLGCGSGASTRALLEALAPATLRAQLPYQAQVVGVDASAGMLVQAATKCWPAGVRFVCGRAEELRDLRARWGLSAPVDGVFAAYLFRNLAARDDVVAAIRDLLAPGGVLVVQEYSVAGSRLATAIWTAVCWLAVIPLSWLTSGKTALYRYLWRSVLRNESVSTFVDRLSAAGFVDVEVRTVPGWQRGILHTFRARVPDGASGEGGSRGTVEPPSGQPGVS